MSERDQKTKNALYRCREAYIVAADNIDSLAYLENREMTMEEVVRKESCQAMINLINDALQPEMTTLTPRLRG